MHTRVQSKDKNASITTNDRPVKKPGRVIRRPIAWKDGRKDRINVAGQTKAIRRAVPAIFIVMAISKEVIPKRGRVKQCLKNRIHEAGVSQIVQTSQPRWKAGTRPPTRLKNEIFRHPPLLVCIGIWIQISPADLYAMGVLGELINLLRHDSHVEIRVVDLIAARAAEKLGPFHVDGDLVAVLGLRMQEGVVRFGWKTARNRRANQATIKPPLISRAERASGYLSSVSPNGCSSMWGGFQALLERIVAFQSMFLPVICKMGAGFWVGVRGVPPRHLSWGWKAFDLWNKKKSRLWKTMRWRRWFGFLDLVVL